MWYEQPESRIHSSVELSLGVTTSILSKLSSPEVTEFAVSSAFFFFPLSTQALGQFFFICPFLLHL
ncbi:hypothetical protein LguiA_032890 [Lonicera macranthoides]